MYSKLSYFIVYISVLSVAKICSTILYVQENTWTCMKTGIIFRCLPRNKKELKKKALHGSKGINGRGGGGICIFAFKLRLIAHWFLLVCHIQ